MPSHKTFEQWMDEVEDRMENLTDGMFSTWDIPDEDYYGMYEDSYTPIFAAGKIYESLRVNAL